MNRKRIYKKQKIIMNSPSKKASKSLPPLPQQHSYIERTIELLDSGCYKGNTLNIDGDIGDYRMKLFRNKDKKDYAKNIHSVFTNSFTDSLFPKGNEDKEVRQIISGIIKQPNRNSITPRPDHSQQYRQNDQVEKYSKGDISRVTQEDDYLFYKYLPQYQRKRWFEVKDRSQLSPYPSEKAESTLSNKKSYSISKKSSKVRHIFAYLQNPIYLQTIK